MLGITNTLQFYKKLVDEFDDCVKMPGSSRHAMNFVITAYHMTDWVWGGFLKADLDKQAELGMKENSISGFRNWLDDRCLWLGQMQELCNGSKHFDLKKGPPIQMKYVSAAFNGSAFNTAAFNEHRAYLALEMGELEGRPLIVPANHIFEAVMRFWRDFLRAHSPYEQIPPTVTKLMDEEATFQPSAVRP